MDVAVLLGELLADRQRDVHLAWRDVDELGSDRCHVPLAGEAPTDPLLRVGLHAAKTLTRGGPVGASFGDSEGLS